MKRQNERGNTILEFSIVAPVLIMLVFGTTSLGILMGRYIQAEQVARDVAHMYSDGIDFSVAANQNIVINNLALGTGMTATGGNGVVVLSQVRTVYAADCSAAGINPCTNQGLPVLTQRIVFGNASLLNSTFGTPNPAILDAQGNIAPSVYLSNSDPTVQATNFETILDQAVQRASGAAPTPPAQPQGDTAYIAELFFQYPDLGFLGWYSAGGAYVRFIYH